MKLKNITRTILILSIFLVLILWPITFLSFNSDVWLLIQKRNEVVLPEKEIKSYNQEIISFFKNDRDSDFLTQLEKNHMLNVRDLLIRVNLLFLSSLSVVFLLFDYLFTNFEKTLKKASLLVVGLLSILLISNLLDFDIFFLKFHQVFFTGNYMFPSSSMLKILYPDSFFIDIFILYFILAGIVCLITLVISCKLKG